MTEAASGGEPATADGVDLAALVEHARAFDRLHINVNDPLLLKMAKRVVPHRTRDPARRLLTAAARPWARRKIGKAARSDGALRLHLASGFVPLKGWLNLDMLGAPVDAPWDLRHGIPVPDDSVDVVFSEHFYEHIPLGAALRVHEETMRVLRPGGIIRVGVPDAGILLGSYAAINDSDWVETEPTRMLAVNSLFYENGHMTMYDEELLTALTRAAGFIDVRARAGGESDIDPAPDTKNRRESATLYVEARKPS